MMFRALLFVVLALFIAFAAAWLADQEGVSEITWLGYSAQIDSSALVVVIALLCVVGIFVDRMVRALVRWPSLFSQGWQARRRIKGEAALSMGFVALAAGDSRAANKQARRAEKLLDKGVLTDLLVAQSSYANGDKKAASRYFQKLAASPDTAYFGQLGLMRLHQQTALETGDSASAKDAYIAANTAFALEPTSPEVAQVILKEALHNMDWAKAVECLKVYLNHSGGQSAQEVERSRLLYASLSLQMAEEVIEAAGGEDKPLPKGVMQEAIALCEQALGEVADFSPASACLVGLLSEKGDRRGAEKQASKAFSLTPHIGNLRILRDVRNDNDGQFITHAMGLAAKSKQADEGYIAVAEFAIEVGIWASASQALSHLSDAFVPHNDYYRIQAAIALGLADEGAHQTALEQAAIAPRAHYWSCQSCGKEARAYHFECDGCGARHAQIWARK